MKRILVPIDFSEQSVIAISSAASLLGKMEGQLILLHVVDEPEDPDERQLKLEKIFAHPKLKNVIYHYKQVLGDLIESITAQEVDLIVMGSKGASGMEGFFLGTNAEKVAKNAECPVYIVKEETDLSSIKSIVFPTSMKKEDDEILGDIKELQAFHKANLHLMKAYDDTLVLQRDVEKRLADFAQFHGLKDYSVTAKPGIDAGDLILEFAEEVDADLIAMATHDRNGIGRLLGGYISGNVINNNPRALWIRALDV